MFTHAIKGGAIVLPFCPKQAHTLSLIVLFVDCFVQSMWAHSILTLCSVTLALPFSTRGRVTRMDMEINI